MLSARRIRGACAWVAQISASCCLARASASTPAGRELHGLRERAQRKARRRRARRLPPMTRAARRPVRPTRRGLAAEHVLGGRRWSREAAKRREPDPPADPSVPVACRKPLPPGGARPSPLQTILEQIRNVVQDPSGRFSPGSLGRRAQGPGHPTTEAFRWHFSPCSSPWRRSPPPPMPCPR
jgi:hypothetical protein